MRFWLVILHFLLVAMITGCASTNVDVSPPREECDLVCKDLRESAKSVSDSIRGLYESWTQKASISYEPLPENIDSVLRKPIKFIWHGPIQPAVESLAHEVGYQFSVLGKMPNVPVIVRIDKNRTTPVEVFRDIGIQGGSKINLILDQVNKKVELVYEE